MGTKITVLPQVVTPVGTDELPISQDTGLGGRITYKATLDQIKGYLGSGTGSVTNVGVNSPDASIGVFGSPITSSGTISLTISSVALDKLDDGGATGGEILTYNGSTNAWEPGFGGSSGIIPNILVGNGGTTYTLTNYTNDTASNYLVFVGGVAQRPTTDFTISGSSIIFGSNIPSGAQILVYAVINIATLNLDSTPIGTVSWFAASAAPTSYLECSGGVVAISDYLDLYYVIGTQYNTGGEGAGNFRVPDLRGEFIRGWDHGRGVDPTTGRIFGSNQVDEFKSHTHELFQTSLPGTNGTVPIEPILAENYVGGASSSLQVGLTGGTETRPRNVALLPCIKALKTVTGNTVIQPANANSFIIDGSMLAKAWVTFNGKKDTTGANSTSNTNRLINASYNVDSVYRNKQGEYKVNFKSGTFDSANYCYTLGMRTDSDGTYQEVLVTYGEKSLSALVVQSDTDAPNELDDLSEICLTFYASGGDLLGSANVFDSTPVGTVNWFAASAAPVGYLECDGSVVSKGQYGELYTIIKDTYTTVLSADHFRLPDLRGEFIRGWDHGRSVDTGRTFGSWQKGSAIVANDIASDRELYNITLDNSSTLDVDLPKLGYDRINLSDYPSISLNYSSVDVGSNVSLPGIYTTFGATRPRNVALLPCIKAQKTVTGDVNTLNFIEKPASPTNGQVLTYNGSTSTWVASAAPTGCARAWVNFDGTRNSSGGVDSNATARFLRSSFNVDSVVRRAENAGLYTVNFTPGTFSSTPVIMSVTASDNDTDSATWLMENNTDACAAIGINANSCRFEFWSSEQAAGFAPKNATLIVYA